MKRESALPKTYIPFQEMILCSNKLIDVQIPFEVDGGIPLLIGRDHDPLIWLNARPADPRHQWQPVVRQNRVLHEGVELLGVGGKRIVLAAGGVTALDILLHDNAPLEVITLDLRPVGLDIHGDKFGLNVGSNQLQNNTFKYVHVMVGIAKGPANRPAAA